MADDFTFKITESFGVLSESKAGWKTELNMVSWGDRPAKYAFGAKIIAELARRVKPENCGARQSFCLCTSAAAHATKANANLKAGGRIFVWRNLCTVLDNNRIDKHLKQRVFKSRATRT